MNMISVVVPVYNSEGTIGNTVKALLKQNYPKNKYEIVLVDDGSTDKTVEVVSKFPVKIIKLKHKGPANARNVGAKKSKGDIVLFTDADCIPDKNWIKNMVKPFKNEKVAGVSGTYKTLNRHSLLARFIGYDIQYRHEKMKKKRYIDFVGTFSAGYRKSVFLKEGGFDTTFLMSSGEDPELSYRIAKKHKIVFQPSAFVKHPHPDRLKRYLRQKFWRIYWRFFMYDRHKEKMLGDSYTPFKSLLSLYIQIFLLGLIGLTFILSFFMLIPLEFLILIILLSIFVPNIKFTVWVWKYDKNVSLIAPFFYFLRNIVYVFGGMVGGLNYFFNKIR